MGRRSAPSRRRARQAGGEAEPRQAGGEAEPRQAGGEAEPRQAGGEAEPGRQTCAFNPAWMKLGSQASPTPPGTIRRASNARRRGKIAFGRAKFPLPPAANPATCPPIPLDFRASDAPKRAGRPPERTGSPPERAGRSNAPPRRTLVGAGGARRRSYWGFPRPPRPRQPWWPAGRWRAPPNQKFATPDDRLGDLRPLSVQRATRSTPCRALRSLAVLARSKPVDVRARAVPSKAKPAFHPCIQDPRRVAVQHTAPHRRLVEHPDNTVDRRSTPWLTMLNVPGASRSTASRRRRRHRPRARTA
jgi:hypothetical protein